MSVRVFVLRVVCDKREGMLGGIYRALCEAASFGVGITWKKKSRFQTSNA